MKPLIRLCIALLALTGGYALAGTTGSVTLSGAVASTLTITSTATAGASALDLDGDGTASEHIVKVSDLAMSANNEQGLTLSFSGASLTKTGGTSIAYSVVTVADAATAPLTGDTGWASGATTFATAVKGDSNRDLYIKYTPLALQDPGTYSGTISLTVSDNP